MNINWNSGFNVFNPFLLQQPFALSPVVLQHAAYLQGLTGIMDPMAIAKLLVPNQANNALLSEMAPGGNLSPLFLKSAIKASLMQTEINSEKHEMNPLPEIKQETMNSVDRSEWQLEQRNYILEIQDKLKQLRDTKIKLKTLRKDKKMILKEQRRIERIMRRANYGLPKTSTPIAPKATAITSTRIPTTLWRPIDFPTAPSTTPSTTTPSTSPVTASLTVPSPVTASLTAPSPSYVSSTMPCHTPTISHIPPDITQMPCDEKDMVTIGPNGTKISKFALQNINWSLKETYITRKILMEVFDRDTLAFHNLTGKPSPAFVGCNKPLKGQLDPLKVADVIHLVTKHLNITEKEVRQTITIKCADENKRVRNELMKMLANRGVNEKSQ